MEELKLIETLQNEEKSEEDLLARSELPDSAFAFVKDGVRKLPIHDAAHTRNALARFNQTQGIPPEEKKSVLRKIISAAKKFNIEVSDKMLKMAGLQTEGLKGEEKMSEDNQKQEPSQDKKKEAPVPKEPKQPTDSEEVKKNSQEDLGSYTQEQLLELAMNAITELKNKIKPPIENMKPNEMAKHLMREIEKRDEKLSKLQKQFDKKLEELENRGIKRAKEELSSKTNENKRKYQIDKDGAIYSWD